MAQAYDIVKGVVGWVDLQSDQLPERLDYLAQHKVIKGYRHVAQAEPDDFLARPAVVQGIRQLAPRGLTYDILIYPSQLKAALHLVRAVPEVNFVIDHLAKPYIKKREISRWSNFMAEIAKNRNVSCKLSGWLPKPTGRTGVRAISFRIWTLFLSILARTACCLVLTGLCV